MSVNYSRRVDLGDPAVQAALAIEPRIAKDKQSQRSHALFVLIAITMNIRLIVDPLVEKTNFLIC